MAKRLTDHREEYAPIHTGPPKAHDVLANIATEWLGSRLIHKAHPGIPRNANELPAWWMKHQAPPTDLDTPSQHSTRDGSGTVWRVPYIDRVAYTLTRFLRIEKSFQGLIIAAAEDGIFWRGDSQEFFIALIAEHDRMKLTPNYRAGAIQKMRGAVGSMALNAK